MFFVFNSSGAKYNAVPTNPVSPKARVKMINTKPDNYYFHQSIEYQCFGNYNQKPSSGYKAKLQKQANYNYNSQPFDR